MLELLMLMQGPAAEAPAAPPAAAPTAAPLSAPAQWLTWPSAEDYEQARPKAAALAEVSGAAVVACRITAEGRLSPCEVESETPAGAGVGAAALPLTAKYRMAAEDRAGTAVAGRSIRLRLRFSPPPPAGLRLVTKPRWTSRPDGATLTRNYPDRALRMGAGGQAVAQCAVSAQGLLTACKVIDEDPLEFGFGDAVLRLAALMQMAPVDEEGLPVAGQIVRLPINFSLP